MKDRHDLHDAGRHCNPEDNFKFYGGVVGALSCSPGLVQRQLWVTVRGGLASPVDGTC